jgi:CubicO group peptidase (beta-lactamase class C family)
MNGAPLPGDAGISYNLPSQESDLIITFSRILLVATLAAMFGSASGSPEQQTDHMFSTLTDARSPGFAVLVKHNGQILFERGYGVRDLQTHVKIDAQTNFRLASCTKQFTATAIMLLVHDGKLRYDQRLTDVFPAFPAYGKTITIRHLLNHTSGLPDYEDLMDSRWSTGHQITDREVLALLETQTHGKFAPGTSWSYSNSGYVVLGAVVAKVSGMPFEDFLHQRIFAPLKMDHTLAYVHGKNEVPERAYGHSKKQNSFEQTDQSSTSATLGDGGVYSNLHDLSLWDDALAHHSLLSAAEMAPAFAPVKLADGSLPHWTSGSGDTDPQPGKPVAYGFGWFLDPYRDHARMWHYGDTIGFMTDVERFSKDGYTIVLLSNRTDLDRTALVTKLTDLYLQF